MTVKWDLQAARETRYTLVLLEAEYTKTPTCGLPFPSESKLPLLGGIHSLLGPYSYFFFHKKEQIVWTFTEEGTAKSA